MANHEQLSWHHKAKVIHLETDISYHCPMPIKTGGHEDKANRSF